jgi:hypothetical protein
MAKRMERGGFPPTADPFFRTKTLTTRYAACASSFHFGALPRVSTHVADKNRASTVTGTGKIVRNLSEVSAYADRSVEGVAVGYPAIGS